MGGPPVRFSGPAGIGAAGSDGQLQLLAILGPLPAPKQLQLPLISKENLRPVTPKVAGSSPVAPAIYFKGLARPIRRGDTFSGRPGDTFASAMFAI